MAVPRPDELVRDSVRAVRAVPPPEFVTATPAMQEVAARVHRFAATDEAVVILGEPGTGKTRLARRLHEFSRRSTGPFHGLNLGHLDNALAATELFGHIKGSFTDARERREGAFVAANRGTLFLDEMSKALPCVQAKLLEFMETRSYKPVGADRWVVGDVRLVFAANEDPEHLVRAGRMLADFIARLGHFYIALPPLRERRADIPMLLRSSVATHAPRLGYDGRPTPVIQQALEQALVAHDWPNNLRELDSLVRRLLVDARGAPALDVDLLVGDLRKYTRADGARRQQRGARGAELADALRACDGNKSGAARLLGISRATFHREYAVMDKRPTSDEATAAIDVHRSRVSHFPE